MSKQCNNTTNMPTFSITHHKHPGMVAVALYELPWKDENWRFVAQLRQLSFNAASTHRFIKATLVRVPQVIVCKGAGIPAEFQPFLDQKCLVKDVTTTDLSFTRFWDCYAYKVGNKVTVEKKWNALKAEDRLLALQGISRQRRHSESKHTDMPYPQTYIDQRRWENEFTAC